MIFVIENKGNRVVGATTLGDFNNFPEFMKNQYHAIAVNDYIKQLSFVDELDKINQVLNAANLFYEVWQDGDVVTVTIDWGDWKYDHLFCDNLLNALGYDTFYKAVTEEDGSDCYSAIHKYRKKEEA